MSLEDFAYLVKEQDLNYLRDIVSTLEASNPERHYIGNANTDYNVTDEEDN